METARKTGYFSGFPVVNHVVIIYFQFCVMKIYIYKFSTPLRKNFTVILSILE